MKRYLVDIDEKHEPLYMFNSGTTVYFVRSALYEDFLDGNEDSRFRISDMVIHGDKVVKSRHF